MSITGKVSTQSGPSTDNAKKTKMMIEGKEPDVDELEELNKWVPNYIQQ